MTGITDRQVFRIARRYKMGRLQSRIEVHLRCSRFGVLRSIAIAHNHDMPAYANFFQFLYLPPSREENVDRCHGSPNVKCRILKVIISPDDQITAFVLEDFQRGTQTWRVALYHTHELLGLPTSKVKS